MKLYELLKGVRTLGGEENLNAEVLTIFSDSRKKVEKGVFVAINGQKRNGNDHINQALSNGATIIITDNKEVFDKCKDSVLVENSRKALSYMWNNFYKDPTKNIKIIAVTGTNGKTSCAYYMYSILKAIGAKRGLISTIECLINEEKIETNGGSDVVDLYSAMTTPDPEILYSVFNEMRTRGVEYIVMEASSHALQLDKLFPINVDYAIFTNLSAEHLDFHKDFESYYQAKKRLFENAGVSIIAIDDVFGERLKNEIKGSSFSCSIRKKADFCAEKIELLKGGYQYEIRNENLRLSILGKINGEFSVSNSLLCVACASLLGIEPEKIFSGIFSLTCIPGRFERVDGSNVYIDYAHTPYAMEKILESSRKINPNGRVIALFGCGGDRDREKRAKMGSICTQNADVCIITADNSRSERTLDIISDILKGVDDGFDVAVFTNREKAIIYAISQMRENDVLMLLGKGHERYEIDKNGKHFFDEREIVRRELKNVKNKSLYSL